MFLYKQQIIPLKREIRSSLRALYGVGKHKACIVVARAALCFPCRIDFLNLYFYYFLTSILNFVTILEVRLKRLIKQSIYVLVDIGCYRGERHKDNLPVRGQRSRTNAKTRKKSLKLDFKDVAEPKRAIFVIKKAKASYKE